MLSLTELKDALAALGVSTATENLRGRARRDELAKRLHHAKMASGEVALIPAGDGEDATQMLDKLSLSELRGALELRQISTQTPGLKGEARRHALIQRLTTMSGTQSGRAKIEDCSEILSSRVDSSDEEEADEMKSQTSSSAYSMATEFIFYDSLSTKRGDDPTLELKSSSVLMPQLSFTRLKEMRDDGDKVGNMQRELFELRSKLHTARQEQQRLVDQSLLQAGIEISLSEISAKLQALEHERRRLQDNYFGHELVTCDAVLFSTNNQISLELVQEDALLLIKKRQETLKRLAERTKEAMAVAKFHVMEIQADIFKSTRQEELNLLEHIRQIESSLNSTSVSPSSQKCCKKSFVLQKADPSSETPILTRCRSMPNGLRSDLWGQMDTHERRQLHSELRSAASVHIRRDRVPISTSESIGSSLRTVRAPTQADKLGIKARFMEKAQRNADEILQVYQNAIKLDENHAANLGNYALFLCTRCGKFDEAYAFFQRAIIADPINAKNLANFAVLLMRERRDYAKSEEFYKKALDVAPKDVNIMGGYADLLSALASEGRENLVRARRVLKKALTLSPSHSNNQLRLALVLTNLEKNDQAERCFERLLVDVAKQQHDGEQDMHKPKHAANLVSIYEKYAHLLHQRGHWARAKEMYDEALALEPHRASLLRNFSCFLRETKPFISSRSEPVDAIIS